MDIVPKMISTKDSSYLSDIFCWNHNAYKQMHHYMEEVENEDVKDVLESLASMHYHHMERVIEILSGTEEEFEFDLEDTEGEDDDEDEEDDEEEEDDE